MPLLPLRSLTGPAVVGSAAALTLLSACGAPPVAERVAPILLTEDDATPRGAGSGARPVELPEPAPAGDERDDHPDDDPHDERDDDHDGERGGDD